MITVDVLVLTYRRPKLLLGTLRSLARQLLPDTVAMRVVVVDNDASQSGRDIVLEFARSFRDCLYVCEPVANIALARNRALQQASGQFAAFIDDDEVAQPRWLHNLLETQRQFATSIVFGPVEPKFSDDVPAWIERGHFFDRPRFKTGYVPDSGATNNVLFAVDAVRRAGVMFNPAFGRGGEDVEFFQRLQVAGLRAVWCDEAVVAEIVPPARTTALWLTKRAYQGGRIYAQIVEQRLTNEVRIRKILVHATTALGCLLALPAASLAGISHAVRLSQRGARSFGHLIGLTLQANR